MRFQEYLNAKPLYYDEIDYSRMPRVYEKIKHALKIPKIIHIIGTNGKGTTGRFLATALFANNYGVGHYTSPHILEFNERVWVNGSNASNERLQNAHEELQKLLSKEDADALSYFEYTTLLAMIIFSECEFVVMEAGLGGEHDATAVFPKILTLVTPIAYDHEAFLGTDIKQIATTKLNAIQNNAIIANQRFEEVYEVAKSLVGKNIARVDDFLDDNDKKNILAISKELILAPYLAQNLSLSIAALKFLGMSYNASDFKNAKLFGRLSHVAKNVLVDVGHNTLAASSIAEALFGEKFTLIYNSYRDKNYKEILSILKPIILSVEIIEVANQRIEDVQKIQSALDDLNIKHTIFKEIQEEQNYLVFGSFSVVEKFLKEHTGVAKYTI
ncbi:MAG: bifunctional folylpolyglutamate synthase/dihydrofolate synthase [Sulfurimonas sp.]|uniref:bifunctional folylpolyglutamate synthase/dihydrofolate synthase n=1 Tax=Sulfurimonas sp. TaxID=2022749 RepID=UPI0026127A66|nr:bifunctional folylpolyglutamate synthase/dihydrofolate synthase [Sulfurimonas sp.]MDD2652646.1 bifunctional folylpolyglutamate synthase/dihydrofolate synthase [Sulfurimonas sp.]MDD3450813.1 bifunctional folylpolyglutamate synthase/dihydrofolate synthase [Sulfurimonas sp.]